MTFYHGPKLPAALLSGLLAVAGLALAAAPATKAGAPDVKTKTEEYIGYSRTITLTPAQEAVKREALTRLPAPCCSENTAYTCCCPCNLAKSIWGLSNHLIAREGADAKQVEKAVREWVAQINPKGYAGNTCGTGGCGKPFRESGCGGMGGVVAH
jgi:hypothetical protein